MITDKSSSVKLDMKSNFTMYWTSLKQYEDCPQQWLWQRGWESIDLGYGLGKGKPRPERRSEHSALMGTVIQAVLERFYNDELWRSPAQLPQTFEKLIDSIFRKELPGFHIIWADSPSREEMHRQIRDAVLGFVQTCKHNKLLGSYARSEVEYRAALDKYNPVGGKFDFLIQRPDTGITILDGKNSKEKGKYTDPDQLRWYAMVYYLSTKEMVNRLGFVYFKFPWGWVPEEKDWPVNEDGVPQKPEPSTGIDWIEFTMDDLKSLAERARNARKQITKERFDPIPTPPKCKLCDWESVCPARQAQRAANSRNRGPKDPGAAPELGGVTLKGGFQIL